MKSVSVPGFRMLLLSVMFISYLPLGAQQRQVGFRVTGDKHQPIPNASVSVTDRNESVNRLSGIADENGEVSFLLMKNGQYIVTITAINFQPFQRGLRITDSTRIIFSLIPSGQTLGGVVVRSTRPLMHQEDDKTIVDPENLVPSSTSGYEVIEKTPGLFVDQDGNIYINSTTPALIYVNGRELKMSTADIATMLKSLPPNSIMRIEILRTPSAKYDASGTGGIVNVVLKKGVKLGLTGSITTGWQQGRYGNKLAGFTLNNNNGRLTSFINLNYSRRDSREEIKTDRLFAADTMLSQDASTRYPSSIYYAGYGLGYSSGKKWDLNFDGRISLNDFDNRTANQSVIGKISNGEVLTSNLARVQNKGTGFLLSNGVSSKYKIDSLGSEWSNDVSYTYARNNTGQFFTTFFDTPPIPASGGDGNNLGTRNFLSGQTDLSWKFAKKITLETGLKSSLLQFNSVAIYFSEAGGQRTKDASRTNTFHYRENINSGYLQASKGFAADILVKMGVRMENTNMVGRQLVPGDTSFSIHRTDLFPYIYISRKVITIAHFDLRAYLVYRRTISRPVYEQLNPFPRYVDQYLSESGNPALRPQFTENYEANISVDETPLLAFGINKTRDIFTNVIYQADSSQSQAYRTYDNLGRNKEFYIRGLGAIPPGKKYFFVVGGQYNHNFYQGLYENKPLAFRKGTWTFFTYHQLKLGKLSQATLNGFIRLKGQAQFYELGNFGALNASINRQVMKQKLIITLSVNDIFGTNQNDFMIHQGSVNASGYRRSDTRRFGINLRYNFGVRRKEDGQNMFRIDSPEKVKE
jgi:iron complex outermembrane recepter protein